LRIAFEVNDSRLSAKPVRLVHDDDVWENALETGALSIEHAAQRIKEDPANPIQREDIDFYGPCDERPSSIVSTHRFSRDTE